MSDQIFIGLYSKSDIIARPWANAGIECHLFDLKSTARTEGNVVYHSGDLRKQMKMISWLIKNYRVVFVAAFPPCDNMAVCGAKHFEKKALNDAMFWAKAMELVWLARDIAEISGAPYFLENPRTVISTLWRQPDYKFNPFEYGGYLPVEHKHSLFPDIYPPRDAYPKETWLWTGNGFIMPEKLFVEPVKDYPGWKSLGGASERTKEIRSVTPEGFSKAVFEANFLTDTYGLAKCINRL